MIVIKILPPCAYQGAKQRVAKEIVDIIFDTSIINNNTKFYDLCCGSGSITLELISRGVSPNNIVMLDKSSWGLFWNKIGDGKYNIDKLNWYIDNMPKDKAEIPTYLKQLAYEDPNIDEEYKYILLQAGSFGGKQIWKENGRWNNVSFRRYWQPTKTSSRRSPVNPMMPMPETIKARISIIIDKCKGLTGLYMDIWWFLENYINNKNIKNSVFYLDPPYKNTTQYGFVFDWEEWVDSFLKKVSMPIYVSECKPYSNIAYQLNFKKSKGGINGKRTKQKEEYLNYFK